MELLTVVNQFKSLRSSFNKFNMIEGGWIQPCLATELILSASMQLCCIRTAVNLQLDQYCNKNCDGSILHGQSYQILAYEDRCRAIDDSKQQMQCAGKRASPLLARPMHRANLGLPSNFQKLWSLMNVKQRYVHLDICLRDSLQQNSSSACCRAIDDSKQQMQCAGKRASPLLARPMHRTNLGLPSNFHRLWSLMNVKQRHVHLDICLRDSLQQNNSSACFTCLLSALYHECF